MNYIKMLFQLYNARRNISITKEQIKNLKNYKLRKLLRFAYENSKYYNSTFKEAGITEKNIDTLPLSSFPTINKKIFLNKFDQIVTDDDLKQDELRFFDNEITSKNKLFQNKYHVVHSSGSTGKPGYFVYDKEAWNSMLIGIIRAALWGMSMPQTIKFLAKKPHILYVAATNGRYGGAMAVGDGIDAVGVKQMFLDINEPLSQWSKKVNDFKPDMIIGYPTAIKILCTLVNEKSIDVMVSRIVSCGEPLGKNLRDCIQSAFKCEILNFYGATESLALGIEIDTDEGMFLFDDLNYIEVENGHTYLTSLYNFVQPIIRYELSDKIILKDSHVNNRYPFTLAHNILGRDEDIMWFKNLAGKDEFLHPLSVEGICIEGLLDYQFVKLSDTSFEMLAECLENAQKQQIKSSIMYQMKKILEEKQLASIDFSIKFVQKIEPDKKTGKKSLIVQSRDGKN